MSTVWKSMTTWRGIKGTNTKSFKNMIKHVILKGQFFKKKLRVGETAKKKYNNENQTRYWNSIFLSYEYWRLRHKCGTSGDSHWACGLSFLGVDWLFFLSCVWPLETLRSQILLPLVRPPALNVHNTPKQFISGWTNCSNLWVRGGYFTFKI